MNLLKLFVVLFMASNYVTASVTDTLPSKPVAAEKTAVDEKVKDDYKLRGMKRTLATNPWGSDGSCGNLCDDDALVGDPYHMDFVMRVWYAVKCTFLGCAEFDNIL